MEATNPLGVQATRAVKVSFVTTCGPEPISLTKSAVHEETLNIDSAAALTVPLAPFFAKNAASPKGTACEVTKFELMESKTKPGQDIPGSFVVTNSALAVFPPKALDAFRNELAGFKWPDTLSDYEF